ncbi:hypothetical protein BH24ACT26_BH24ACT26_14790 [soil metagenome]
MTGPVVVLVTAGLAAVLAVSITGRFDAMALVLLVLIVAIGALGVAVARSSDASRVVPARCPECDGLVSANAPYCKHCGAATTERS